MNTDAQEFGTPPELTEHQKMVGMFLKAVDRAGQRDGLDARKYHQAKGDSVAQVREHMSLGFMDALERIASRSNGCVPAIASEAYEQLLNGDLDWMIAGWLGAV